MKRTYHRPQIALITAADALLRLGSYGVYRYDGEGKQLEIEDKAHDWGKIIYDGETPLPDGKDPWDADNW